MRRYSIANNGKTYFVECDDLNELYSKGLPSAFIGAQITFVNIDAEIAANVAQESARSVKKIQLKALKGKDFSKAELNSIIDYLLDLL